MLGSVSGSCFCACCNDGGRGAAVVERVASAAGAWHGVSGFWLFPRANGPVLTRGQDRSRAPLSASCWGHRGMKLREAGTSQSPGEVTGTGKLHSGGPMWEF